MSLQRITFRLRAFDSALLDNSVRNILRRVSARVLGGCCIIGGGA